MLKAKQSVNSFMSFLSNVLFPAPEGPHITTSRVIIVVLDKGLLRWPGKYNYIMVSNITYNTISLDENSIQGTIEAQLNI